MATVQLISGDEAKNKDRNGSMQLSSRSVPFNSCPAFPPTFARVGIRTPHLANAGAVLSLAAVTSVDPQRVWISVLLGSRYFYFLLLPRHRVCKPLLFFRHSRLSQQPDTDFRIPRSAFSARITAASTNRRETGESIFKLCFTSSDTHISRGRASSTCAVFSSFKFQRVSLHSDPKVCRSLSILNFLFDP